MGSPSTSRPFPGFDRIFLLAERGHAFRVKAEEDFDYFRVTFGEIVPAAPVVFRWYMGAKVPGDVIMTGGAFAIIVHTRVIDILLDHRLSGWGTYPVVIRDRWGEHHPDYHGFVFLGRCGRIDDGLSTQVERQMPARKITVLKGLFFDPATWDGSDFFMPTADTGHKFVTDDVRRAFKKAKVKNLECTAAAELEHGRVEPGAHGH